jgi:hypothetical protein
MSEIRHATGEKQMAKKARKARTGKLGNLLIIADGNVYFIPADKVGAPLEDFGPRVLGDLRKEISQLVEKRRTALIDLDFAMQIRDGDSALGLVLAKKRN